MTTRRTSTSLEQRLMTYLEDSIDEIKRQVAELVKGSATKAEKAEHDRLASEVDRLKTDVALLQQRTRNTEEAHKESAQRPFQTWQLVLGSLSVLTVLVFQFAGLVIEIINLTRHP